MGRDMGMYMGIYMMYMGMDTDGDADAYIS